MSDLGNFVQLAEALAPWRHNLVFIGGWAHRLFRLHTLAAPPDYPPLITRDADVAFADGARLEGSIKSALIPAGFVEEFFGEHTPPVSHYTLGDEAVGFYAEFLTPLRGSGIKRNGQADPARMQALCELALDEVLG